MDRYNKYHDKAVTRTHKSWWLVLGLVTTKEYHLRLCIDYIFRPYDVL